MKRCRKGCIVTIDAMGCQTTIAQQIQEKEAEYVLAVKGNQGLLQESIHNFCLKNVYALALAFAF